MKRWNSSSMETSYTGHVVIRSLKSPCKTFRRAFHPLEVRLISFLLLTNTRANIGKGVQSGRLGVGQCNQSLSLPDVYKATVAFVIYLHNFGLP